ncbi:MAG: 23S rRNA (guanosine(2251)-2'-O)-methyltransferase RlmB [Thermodesulfobacteriota bacterium]
MNESESGIIAGLNPVLEALRARGRTIRRVYLARGRSEAGVREILELAAALDLKVQRVERARLDRLAKGRSHQGVLALADPFEYSPLEELIERTGSGPALLLLLDGVQDPMNLGSLLRSAEAAGAVGVIVPRERAAPVSPAVIKASAGAAEHLPVARVVNLARTMEGLKAAGFWMVGADADAPESLYQVELPERMGLVVGGEGTGLRRLTREKCDRLVAIPLSGNVGSLNAAVAGAICLFEYVRRRPISPRPRPGLGSGD